MITKNILITGRPGVGKTTLIKKCIQILDDRAGGFYTEEVMDIEKQSSRFGFRLKTLQGQEGFLAEKGFKSPYTVGPYGIHLDVIELIGVPAINFALQRKEWILIDEIGKMEESSKAFKEVVVEAFNSSRRVLATIRWDDSSFTKKIKARDDITLFSTTVLNRDSILDLLKKEFVIS